MTSVALGRYRLQHRLGVGSMGSVYDAVDERTGRTVVVKRFDGVADGWSAWLAELRLATRLQHPRIVRCLDGGHDPDVNLMTLVFEKVDGGSFRRRLVEHGPLDDAGTWALLRQVGEALAEAHRGGVVHRDIKPENVLWSHEGWRVTDFGAGRFLERGSSASTIVGSTDYIAPEVLTGSASFACDQFSLGALGVEARTGQRFSDETRSAFVVDHRGDVGLPGVLAQLLATRPEHRFPTMDVVVALAARQTLEGYEQRPLRAGAAWRFDDVVSTSDGPAPRSRRVLGVERFVHAFDAEGPVVVAGRRVVAVLELLKTMYSLVEGDEVLSASASLDETWCRTPKGLRCVVKGETVVEGPCGEVERLGHQRLLSLQPDAGCLFVAQHGEPGVLSAVLVGKRLLTSMLPTPGPVFALGYEGDTPVAAAGTISSGVIVELSPGAARQRLAVHRSVDTLALSSAPTSPQPVSGAA
ncbi:MAG: serine/threonine-protein kinase [Myxococcaceae bacterium]|nr:serine/threonine-protein kinase [Myxococcaceae bacterium]